MALSHKIGVVAIEKISCQKVVDFRHYRITGAYAIAGRHLNGIKNSSASPDPIFLFHAFRRSAPADESTTVCYDDQYCFADVLSRLAS